ncbi:MAG: MFS transporter [Oscillospiraceae bacterium]|jgi:UMF1 family MFS transporter|nr:MFS transporter [Oscillospiraceae bacterium]
MFKKLNKQERAWVLYDLAESPYTITVMATIMGMYFFWSANEALGDGDIVSPYWAFATAASMLFTGALAPIIGALTGYLGKKKFVFNIFVGIGALSTAAIAIVPEKMWYMLLIVYVISMIGYSGANKVYNAFLVDVTSNDRMNRISTLAFGVGYLGCIPPFIASIAPILLIELGIINISFVTAYRIAFLITAVWWLLFTIPMWRNVNQKYGQPIEEKYVRKSFVTVWLTIKEICKHRSVLLFLLAFFLYYDGVSSIISMATIYGMEIGIGQVDLLLVLLATQFVAGPCAIIYGRLADKFGTKSMIYFGICTYVVICMIALLMSPDRDIRFLTALFWGLAMLVGTAQGGIQALSRAYFGKIVPKDKSNEFFGFYNIFGRLASIMGTTLFGIISVLTGHPHLGIAGIVVLFIAAAIIFWFVPNDNAINMSESK